MDHVGDLCGVEAGGGRVLHITDVLINSPTLRRMDVQDDYGVAKSRRIAGDEERAGKRKRRPQQVHGARIQRTQNAPSERFVC